MDRHSKLLCVAFSVVLAACAVLWLQTSLARASTIPVTSTGDGASCGANTKTPRCAINEANALGTFPRVRFSQSAAPARPSIDIIVTDSGDGSPCAPNALTLRCAINLANASGTFNNVLFSQAVTHVILTDTLPTITSQGTFIDGALPNNGVVIIDAAAIFGNALVIDASDVLIFGVSIINTPSNAVDIQILGGRAVRIAHNYLGIVPGAANCNFRGHTRNSGFGVDVATSAGDSSVGSAYIADNFIGCHSSGGHGNGIRVESSWTYVGQDVDGILLPNYIGVQPGGSQIPNDVGVALISGGGVFTATNDSVTANTIAGNLVNGVELDGPATSSNLISGTVIYGNGHDGICENGDASDNVWTHVSIYQNGGLGINKNGHCYDIAGPSEVVDPPYPVITSVNPSTYVVLGKASPSACSLFCLTVVTVELYRVFPNPRGFGEGKTFVGATTTDSAGNWSLADPNFSGGCYTAFETTFEFLFGGSHSSEFGPDNCRTWLPLVQR